MRMSVDTRGLSQQLRRAVDARELTDEAIKAVRRGAARIQGDVVQSIQQSPPTGKVYRRGNINHQASSPGNPPRTDTGRLVQSTRVEPNPQGADVVVAAKHAKPLEYGTRHMAPRPFLAPAAERNAERLAEEVGRAMGSAWED